MSFDYVPVVVSAADDGEPLMLFRPEVMVAIQGPESLQTVRVLVDTGADYTILPLEVAQLTGIPTTPTIGPRIQTFGGQEIDVRYADVELQLGSAEEILRWQARVFFAVDPAGDGTAVVGHMGFLDFFTTTFRGDLNRLELEPNGYLPRIP